MSKLRDEVGRHGRGNEERRGGETGPRSEWEGTEESRRRREKSDKEVMGGERL